MAAPGPPLDGDQLSEVQQLEAMAMEFAQRNQQLEAELGQVKRAEDGHLNEILRLRALESEQLGEILKLRDDVARLEQARPPASAGALSPGSAKSPGVDWAAHVSKLEVENASLRQERDAHAAKVSALETAQASLQSERQRQVAQAGALQLDAASMQQERDHLVVQVNAAQEELRSVKEHYERRVQELEAGQALQAQKADSNGSAEEHLAHISQLKQVVAAQDTRIAKQLAELSVSSQRCAELQDKVGKMGLREREQEEKLVLLQRSAAGQAPGTKEVAVLQAEKQELIRQNAELQQNGAKRIAELEGLLSRSDEGRRQAEAMATWSRQETVGSAEGAVPTKSQDDAATISQLNATISELRAQVASAATRSGLEPQAGQADRIKELEAEVAAHMKRNFELNQVIRSVQEREARIASLEQALTMPGSPTSSAGAASAPTLGAVAGGPASPMGAAPARGSASAAMPAGPEGPLVTTPATRTAVTAAPTLFPAPAAEAPVNLSSLPLVSSTTPNSTDVTPGRLPASSPAMSAPVAAQPQALHVPQRQASPNQQRHASPVRYIAMPWSDPAAAVPPRGVSPVRMIAVRQLQSMPIGGERQAAISPIRVIGTHDGPVREVVRREVSPVHMRARAPRVSGGTPLQSSRKFRDPLAEDASTAPAT